jgi:hypothetical protein
MNAPHLPPTSISSSSSCASGASPGGGGGAGTTVPGELAVATSLSLLGLGRDSWGFTGRGTTTLALGR